MFTEKKSSTLAQPWAMDAAATAEHYQAIIASSDDAIMSKTLLGVVTSWNAGASVIFGYSGEEMLGQPMLRLFPANRLTEETLILERILEGHKVDNFETVRVHKDGHLVNVAVTISPVRNSAGVIIGASKIARDITEKIALEKSKRHFEAIVSASDDAIISKSLQGIITSWNLGAERIFGYLAAEMIGQSVERLLPADRSHEELQILGRIERGEKIEHFETERLHKDGHQVPVSVTISPIHDAQGRVVGASKIARDISERKAFEQRLNLISSVFTYTSEAVAIIDAEGNFLEINDAFTHVTGYARSEIIGKSPLLFRSSHQGPEIYQQLLTTLAETGHCQGEVWSRRKSGEAFAGLLTVSRICDANGNALQNVAIFADITPLRQHQERLERIVNFDPLTNLPNRLLLSDRLSQALAQAKRNKQSIAVAYLDLDGFKVVNDQHGHDVGDQLLIAISQRMQSSLREVDTLARMGGDEFVAVLTDVGSVEDFRHMLERILKACSEPVCIDGLFMQVSASMGVTLYPQDESDVDQLMRHADQAMYEAKQAGKNCFHLFDTSRDAEIKSRSEKLNRIAQGLQAEEFVLYFQPKVNMRTGELIGLEALVRWQHPNLGLLPPAVFLPLIENHLLIETLGVWVIEAALRQLGQWKRSGFHVKVSINIAARQFQAQQFPERLAAQVALHPEVSTADLELELLETSALENIDAVVETMRVCHRLGFRFSVDDFGTGYSSLTYLKRLPAETLKIDQSFVRDMLEDHEDLAIVKGVIGLAAAFNRQVIAEGVETTAHGEQLLALGCHLAQGYGIARPMPAADVMAWASSWRPPVEWTTQAV